MSIIVGVAHAASAFVRSRAMLRRWCKDIKIRTTCWGETRTTSGREGVVGSALLLNCTEFGDVDGSLRPALIVGIE